MDIFKEIKEISKQSLSRAKGCHAWDHTERVLKLALHIGKKENANLKIVHLAALLHDIARKYQDESNGKICHAQKGAELAREILAKYALSEDDINNVVHCIEAHRFRTKVIPSTKEAKVISDADNLDAIGAVGIGRTFLFAGEIGSKLHNKDVNVEETEEYSEEDTAYREFLVKLSKIHERMLTEEGKQIAKGRHEFMVSFFDRINKEVDGEL